MTCPSVCESFIGPVKSAIKAKNQLFQLARASPTVARSGGETTRSKHLCDRFLPRKVSTSDEAYTQSYRNHKFSCICRPKQVLSCLVAEERDGKWEKVREREGEREREREGEREREREREGERERESARVRGNDGSVRSFRVGETNTCISHSFQAFFGRNISK